MMWKEFFPLLIVICAGLSSITTKAQECGRVGNEFGGTIFGGEKSKKAEFPWMVALINRKSNEFFCSGTLVSGKHVLSAAHCYQQKDIPAILSPYVIKAFFGRFDLSVENEIGSRNSLIFDIVIHADWRYDHHKYDADLSILVLEETVKFSDFIQPICLPKQSDDEVTGTGTVVGWGKSETSGDSSDTTQMKLQIPTIDPAVCYPTFPALAKYSSNRMFCGGYDNQGKAPCLGDSGGGFYILNAENFWIIQGIISGSLIGREHGCDINSYSLYTNVAKFSDWINKTMNDASEFHLKFVIFHCVLRRIGSTFCTHTFKGSMTRSLKIRVDLSLHEDVNSPYEIKHLEIDFSPSTHIFTGLGGEFPNLQYLNIRGYTISFIERQDFSSMKQLKIIWLNDLSIKLLPDDVLSDLPNLTIIIISETKLEALPNNFFSNQRKLKRLSLLHNRLKVLNSDLIQNNLQLEYIGVHEVNLKEINVDFTRSPLLKLIDLERNECIDHRWMPNGESIQSFQHKINHNCKASKGLWSVIGSWLK